MARMPDAKQIKSARRVLEVLEFFNASRTQATVMDIAREYGYPQSSTSELLGCLVELGFLTRDRVRRTYRPTAKVAVLGSWTHPTLFRRGTLLGLMDDLAQTTGCTVVLGGAVGTGFEYYHVVHGTSEIPHDEGAGILTRGAVGRLLLSTRDRGEIRKVVHRLNSEVDEEHRVRCEDLLAAIDAIERQGYSASPSLARGEGGVIACRLPQQAADEALGLGIVVGEGDTRGFDYHLRALRSAITAGIGPVLAHHHEPDFSRVSAL
jgi:DNA-binding IclR family transcriptional regulator